MCYINMARFCRPKSGYSPSAILYPELGNGDYLKMKRLEVKPGDRYSRLSIVREIEPAVSPSRKHRMFLCLCGCGNQTRVSLNNLRTGAVKSCGCLQTERARETMGTHLMSSHPLYGTWNCIIGRCYRKSTTHYHCYGGRGIDVCKEWRKSPKPFIKWATDQGWKPGLEVDRIDNDKGYSPENCRITTHLVNMRNRRVSKEKRVQC